MKKTIIAALILMAGAATVVAQVVSPPAVQYPAALPGACANPPYVWVYSGNLYYCTGGVPTKVTGGGGSFTALTGDATSTSTGGATTVVGLNGTLLSGLSTGYLHNTTTTGVPTVVTSIPNGDLVNSAITIAGTSVSLGGSTSSLPSPGAIGGTTPSTVAATTITGTSSITLGTNGGTGGSVVINGSTSGSATINASATGTLALPGGTTMTAPVLGTPASGVITNLTGTCASCTANVATTATATATSTNSTFYIPFISGDTSGNYGLDVGSTLSFNPSTGALSASGSGSSSITSGASGNAGSFNVYNNTAYTAWLSGATTTNGIAGPTTVPSNLDLFYCAVSSTTCTLTDTGYAYNAIPNADLAHSAMTIGGTSTSLGGSYAPAVTIEASGCTTGSHCTANGVTGFYYCNTSAECYFTLDAPTAGKQYCFGDYAGQTNVLSITSTTSVYIVYKGTNGTVTTGTLVSGGAAGDFTCMVGVDTTHYMVTGAGLGTWTNN